MAPSTTAAAADPDKIAPGTVMALVAMGLGVIVIANDFTALNVALPAIEGDFNVDLGTAQWVINAYCLVFGMAIVTGGRLADLFGRRRAFFLGSALFAGFSLLGGLAPSAIFLIIDARRDGDRRRAHVAGHPGHDLRGAAGVEGGARGRAHPRRGGTRQRHGAAPGRRPDRRALAGAGSSSSTCRSPIIAVLVTWAKVHQPRPEVEDERIDYSGIATLSAGLFLILLAFDQAADWGFGEPGGDRDVRRGGTAAHRRSHSSSRG